jgi:hypothetical protein
MPKRLEKFGLQVAPEKTRILRFSCFRPGLNRRFAFLGFELYWNRDRRGDLRVMKRTARKKLQQAKRRIKIWIKANRHLPGRQFIKELNRKLVGLQLLRIAQQRKGPGQLLQLQHRVCLQMAQPARRQEAQLQLGTVQGGVEEVGCGVTPDRRETATACGLCIEKRSSRKRVQPRNPVRKNCTPGSVRGAPGNGRPYRESLQELKGHGI